MAFAASIHLSLKKLVCDLKETHRNIPLCLINISSRILWGHTKTRSFRGVKQVGTWPTEEELKFIRKSRSGIAV